VPDPKNKKLLLLVHFDALKDPRRHQHKVVYPLPLVLLIAISAALCGLKDWGAAADFAEEKRDWLAKLWPFDGETPSADTLERVFSRLDAKAFRACFLKWMHALAQIRGDTDALKQLALDGKSIEGARDPRAPTVPLHLMHAYLTEHSVLLGMEPCAGAPGESQAALAILETLDLRGIVVTGDANLTTKAVADAVIERGGSYLFALKGNRGPAHAEVKIAFCTEEDALNEELSDEVAASTYDSGEEEDHGRIERRRAWVFAVADKLPSLRKLLPHVVTVVAMVRERKPTPRAASFKPSKETSFYVSNLSLPAEQLGKFVRDHWLVENALHRQLDVVFHEDATRVAKSHAAENLATICRVALELVRADTMRKGSAPKKMRHATFNDDYRTHLVTDLPS
jgi:predicted transposase YbfD/YdcC